jgi:WD40 repeat protein
MLKSHKTHLLLLLPVEIHFFYVSYLDSRSVVRLKQTCRTLYTILDQQHYWKLLIDLHTFDIPFAFSNISDYKELFKQQLILTKRWREGPKKKILAQKQDIIMSFSVSKEGFYFGSLSGFLSVWNNKKRDYHCHIGGISCILVDALYVYTASWDATVKIWSKDNFADAFRILEHEHPIVSMTLHNNQLFVGTSRGTILIRSFDGNLIHMLTDTSNGLIGGMVVHGNLLICGAGKDLALWNLETLQQIHRYSWHTESISALTISNGYVITGSDDRQMTLWEISKQELIQRDSVSQHKDGIRSLCIAGNYVISGSYDSSLLVWKREQDKWAMCYSLLGHTGDVNVIQYCDGNLFSVSDDGRIIEWDFKSNQKRDGAPIVDKQIKRIKEYTWADAAAWALELLKAPGTCYEILVVIRENRLYPNIDTKATPSNTLNQTLHQYSQLKSSNPRFFVFLDDIPHRFINHSESLIKPLPP